MFHQLPVFLHQEQQRRLRNLFVAGLFLSIRTTLHRDYGSPRKPGCSLLSSVLWDPRRAGNGDGQRSRTVKAARSFRGMVLCGAPSKMCTTIPAGVWGYLRVQAALHGAKAMNGYVPAVNLIWATHRNRSSQMMLAVCPKPHQMRGIPYFLILTAVWGFPNTEICHYNLVV